MILDEETFGRVRSVLRYAAYAGKDQAETLHDNGLLWTPTRERQVRAGAMSFLAKEMAQWEPHEFLRTVNRKLEGATPTDMYHAVMAWILKHADHATRHSD